MALLKQHGYEVETDKVSRTRYYWVPDRRFSVPELKIILDALQAAAFVTEKKTAELTEKVAALGGSHREEILKQNIVRFNTRKHTNESIYFSVNELEQALTDRCQASFYAERYRQGDRRDRRVSRGGRAARRRNRAEGHVQSLLDAEPELHRQGLRLRSRPRLL